MNFRNLSKLARLVGPLSLATLILALPLLALAWQPLSSQEPNPEAQARGAFLINRKKTSETDSNTAPKPPTVTPPPKPSPTPTRRRPRRTSPPTRPAVPAPAPVAPDAAAVPIGIGYTLYQRKSRTEEVRVSPTKPFQKDDSVRFVIEPNIDGYLYIFHTEDNGEPEMIFPNHRLNQGDNKITAHVPYEVPSRHSKIAWFTFDENPAIENLLVVVSRKRLPDVLFGPELIKYCQTRGADCTWKPSRPQFELALTKSTEPKIESMSNTLGQVQAMAENLAISRGFKLKLEDPEPTLVMVNVSPTQDIFVMKTQLIHR